jgi:hypothetical protein
VSNPTRHSARQKTQKRRQRPAFSKKVVFAIEPKPPNARKIPTYFPDFPGYQHRKPGFLRATQASPNTSAIIHFKDSKPTRRVTAGKM